MSRLEIHFIYEIGMCFTLYFSINGNMTLKVAFFCKINELLEKKH